VTVVMTFADATHQLVAIRLGDYWLLLLVAPVLRDMFPEGGSFTHARNRLRFAHTSGDLAEYFVVPDLSIFRRKNPLDKLPRVAIHCGDPFSR